MKKNRLFSIFGIILIVVGSLSSCKKKDTVQPSASSGSGGFTIKLSSDSSSVKLGDQTRIRTTVTGASGSITYQWSVNTGSTIVGNGNSVFLYASCPSCVGPNIVTCKATDTKSTTSNTVTVNVYQ